MNRSPFTFDTARLRLREFREADAEALFRLNSDPEVMRYTGDDPFTDPASARHYLRHYPAYDKDGFGRWALESKADNEFLGFCGLRRSDSTGEVDLALRLFRKHWSRGFATEAARGALQAGFEQFGLQEVIGRAMRENLPSITILQKVGMKYRDMVEEDGEFWLVYAVDRERFMGDFLNRA